MSTTDLRDVLDEVLADWHLIRSRGYTTWRTYRHCSRRWIVALCVDGAAAGTLRVTELDMLGRVVYRPVERVWEFPDPVDVPVLLWESGAPEIPHPVAVAA